MNTALQTLDLPELPRLNDRRRCGIITESRQIQGIILERLSRPKVTDAALAALSRSYCLLAETVRVWKGIPAPGQLRPDLDPVQLQRAIKRARARRPFDIGGAVSAAVKILETDAEPVQPPTTRPQKPKPETKAQAEPTEAKANDPEQPTDDEAEAG